MKKNLYNRIRRTISPKNILIGVILFFSIFSFLINSNTAFAFTNTINVLTVGGGGGGATGVWNDHYGGGGGGGKVTESLNLTVTAQSYAVTVGNGGSGGTSNYPTSPATSYIGTSGGTSSFSSLVSATGGYAANPSNTIGGGNASYSGAAGSSYLGGGGAGANGNGSSSAGGVAKLSSITGNYYGGGGCGGNGTTCTTPGYGGGAGTESPGINGLANTGGGGGGSGVPGPAGSGAAGVVVVSYPTGTMTATGGTITTSGANTIHTFTSSGTFTINSFACDATNPPSTGPAGYIKCSNQNGTCSVPLTTDVAYGCGTNYTYQTSVTGSIGCLDNVFGDPYVGVMKACFYNPTPSNVGPLGSPTNPYLITNQAELSDMRNHLSSHYKLMNNITLSGAWTPIDYFTGTLDGNGKTISGLSYNFSTGGFFGTINSTSMVVKNIGMINVNLTDASNAGALIGTNNGGTILNSYSTGYINTYLSDSYAGGLVGMNNSGTISNSYSTVGVDGYWAAGLAGTNSGTIVNCYSTGPVSGNGYTGLTNGNATNSFWDINTSGTVDGGGTGKTTAQMKTLSTFSSAGWDITTPANYTNQTWVIAENGYPKLGWQYKNITTWADLNNIRNDLNNFYILKNNLSSATTGYSTYAGSSANSGAGWLPIPSGFTGNFDGGGYTISDLYINRPTTSYVGLFSVVAYDYNIFSNLNLANVNITGGGNTGALLGSGVGSAYVINNVVSSGTVTSSSQALGGLVGSNSGTITNSATNTTVIKTGVSNHGTGGLVGYNYGPITNSFATGDVTGTGYYNGGFVGYNQGTISNSYATGNVLGGAQSGGFIGYNATGNITKSYSTGSVAYNSSIGGFIGLNYSTVTGSFWDTQTSGRATSSGGTGKTTAEMQTMSTFSGASWSIADAGSWTNQTWRMNDGLNYPKIAVLSSIITASSGTNGSISPVGPWVVGFGGSQTFTITPNANYVANVLVDGVSQGNISSYTFSNVFVNHTISVTFAVNNFTVSTSVGTGGSVSPTSASVANGATTALTITPDSGYSIGSVSGCGGSLSGNTYTTGAITGACTVTATFSPNSYTITFNSAGGSAVTAITQNYGTAVTPPANPTKTGYTFAGWSPAIPATMPATSQTITATWNVNTYTITFDSAGGTSVTAITQNYGTAITAPASPTKTGYTFTGWSPAIPATMGLSQTLTAQWTINSYTYTFAGNGATTNASPASVTQNYLTAIATPTAPLRTGYTFTGWSPAIPATMPVSGGTSSAGWSINSYNVTFDGNGVTGGTTATQSLVYNTPTALTTNGYTRIGYTFTGWNTAANGSGTAYANGASYTIGAAGVTLYAQWTANSYTITFDSAGGSAVTAITQNYGTAVTAPASPTKTGYAFTGWSPAIPATMGLSQTITATWNVNSYTITFDSAGGTAVSAITQAYGTATYAPLADPIKTGYTFAGWSPAVPATMGLSQTITATWSVIPYSLSYSAGTGGTISGTASQTVNYGGNGSAVTAVPSTGYSFTGWTERLIFTNGTPTFTPPAGVSSVEALVVAGGGGGGMDMGGGGGGGGVLYNPSYSVTPSSPYTVTVGRGGYGAPQAGSYGQPSAHQYAIRAASGGNSIFGSMTSIGGGYGGSSYVGYTPDYGVGGSGGSGGGGSGYCTSGGGGAGTAGQGNAGGGGGGCYYSGGGGGAGSAGTSGPSQADGGSGILNAILGANYYWGAGGGGAAHSLGTGGNGGYGGGGGAGVWSGTVGLGAGGGLNSGTNGGNAGGVYVYTAIGGNGGNNTGSGGGGGAHYYNKGGNGGSGVVIFKYTSASAAARTETSVNANKILVANFSPNSYTITFDSAGGSAVSAITQSYATAVTAPAAPTKTGYTFVGWSPAVPATMGLSQTITATWTANTNTITFNGNGATGGATASQNIATAVSANLTANGYTRTGYTFAGWNTVANGSGTAYANSASYTMGTASITLYAQWTINSYTITFDSAGGTAVTAITQNYGTAVTPPASPTKTGYTFAGWSPAVPATMGLSQTITAQWTINSFTLTYAAGANGTLSGTTSQSISYGSNGTAVTAVPNSGYYFINWSDSSTQNPRTDTNITASISVTANFGISYLSCRDILDRGASTGSKIYRIDPDGVGGNNGVNVYCDMTTDGGGWTLVLLNSSYATPPKPNWTDAVSSNNITGTQGTNLDGAYDQILGVDYWDKIGSEMRIETGATSSSISHRVYVNYNLNTSNNYALSMTNPTIPIGGSLPGIYSYHAASRYQFSSYDADHDDYGSGNCSTFYGNTPFWYDSCWSGNFWGGGDGGGYANAPFWDGSGSDYYNWGAIWVRGPKNLVLYAPLEEGSGTTTRDWSPNNYVGSITGATWTSDITGASNRALNFTGTSDKIQVNNPVLTGTGDFTVEAWIYASGDTSDLDYIMGNYGLSNSQGLEFYVYQNQLNLYIQGSVSSSAASLQPNTWYHVAATRTGGAIKIYINGVQNGSGTLAGSIGGAQNWTIGNGPDYTSEKFEGTIDDVRVYARALSNAEIISDIRYARLDYVAGANGTLSGTTTQVLNYNGNGSAVTAIPNTGYYFVNWSDGSTTNPRTDTGVVNSKTITANFAINTYTVTYTAGANGTITGTTPQTINYGASATAVTATPNANYHFISWSDGVLTATRTDTNVTANITVTASFAINTYLVSTSANAGGTVTPASQTVNHGSTTTFTITPNAQYIVSATTGCNGSLVGTLYTTGAITGICTVTITFTAIVVPTVTTQAVTGITMSGAVGNGNITATGNQLNTKRGFVYDTVSRALPGNVAPISSLYVSKVEETGSFNTGAFTGSMTGLASGTTYYVRAYSYNSIGYSYGGEVSFTTDAFPTLTLSGYRIFSNLNTTDVASALSIQSTAPTLSNSGDAFRMRLLLHVATSNLTLNGASLKLQYALKSGTCDTGFVGETYADVTNSTPVAYYDNPTPNDKIVVVSNVGDPTHNADVIVNQSYVESNNFSNSFAPILIGQDGKWDLSLYDKSVGNSVGYCLRVVKSDGGLLGSYSVIPEYMTAPYRSRGGGGGSMTLESVVTPSAPVTGGSSSGSGQGVYLTKCNDGINNNDGDELIDAADPQCHAGGTLQGAYVPANDSEIIAPALPTGGCVENCGGDGNVGDLGFLFKKAYSLFNFSSFTSSLLGMVFNVFTQS